MSRSFTFPELKTERLTLRLPKMEDFAAFSEYQKSDRMTYVGGPVASAEQRYRKFSNLAGQWILRGFGPFVFERNDTGEAIGGGGLWFPATHPELEIGWAIWSADAEGQGYAFEGVSAARDHARTAFGLDALASFIDVDNERSIRLAEKLGAQKEETRVREDWTYHVYRHPTIL
jgi:RimJ/RimL family protein N-acetyltransferase